MASISAQREQARETQLTQRRARWEADRQGWRGSCLACLDSGVEYLTEQDCRCAAGVARVATRAQREAEQRLVFIAEQTQAVMRRAEIPPDYATWTLDTFPRRARALAHLRSFVDRWDGHEGLMLFGSYGVGKTSLMIGLMRELVTRWLSQQRHLPDAVIRARFLRASELFTRLRAAMDSEDGEYDRLMTAAKQTRVLVLDDLGRENPKSEWVSETLFEIIDARYAHGLPIFATTNYTPETLGDRLGVNAEAIMERINDRCVWVKVTGASMRQSQARVIE